MRANIRQQEAELNRQLQMNGFAQGVLEASPTGVRRVAAETFRRSPLPARPNAPALFANHACSQTTVLRSGEQWYC